MTDEQIKQEIDRVEKALSKTKSEHLKRDYTKYLKRLKRQYKRGGFKSGNTKGRYQRNKAV